MTAQPRPETAPRDERTPDGRRPRFTPEQRAWLRETGAALRRLLDDPASYTAGVVPAWRRDAIQPGEDRTVEDRADVSASREDRP
jgi:hypothetical protein